MKNKTNLRHISTDNGERTVHKVYQENGKLFYNKDNQSIQVERKCCSRSNEIDHTTKQRKHTSYDEYNSTFDEYGNYYDAYDND